MSKLANQWIEVFRAGDYGDKGVFSEADLDTIVANYKPGTHEAPAVIGHPKTDAPAYGWFDGLKRSGNVLVGKMSQVDPVFAEMVEAGKFKKRSASFYKTPKGLSLRHVGFLGAQPPVVKGLADCKFADDSESVELEFQESEMADVTEAVAIGGFKAWLQDLMKSGKPGETNLNFSEAQAADVAAAVKKAVDAAVAPLQTKLDEQTLQFSEHTKKVGNSETVARGEAAVTKLRASGRWVPAFEKMGLPLVFAELAKTTDTVEFGEGDGKKKQTPLEIIVDFMEAQPKIVPAGVVYDGKRPGTPGTSDINPGRMTVDQNSVQFSEEIKTYMSEHKDVSYFDAATTVERLHPELAKPGGASAGSV